MNLVRIRDGHDSNALSEAVEILRKGGVVAVPTETVYGLAGMTRDLRAIETIYALKNRPSNNPLIAHVLDADSARGLVAPGAWHDLAEHLAERFWPGPLTLVLPRSDSVPEMATGGLRSIAVRSPSHPVAREILERLEEPFSAPSANRSGCVSPTSALHVKADFPDSDLMILDGGACEVGLESTVLDLREPEGPRLLRPGSVSLKDLEPFVGSIEVFNSEQQGDSPGTSIRHYAPKTPLELVGSIAGATSTDAVIRFGALKPKDALLDLSLGEDPEVAAKELYAALRTADTCGAERILIQLPPAGEQWRAIVDRVRRASV